MNRHDIRLDLEKPPSGKGRLVRPVTIRQGDLNGCQIAATVLDHGRKVMPTQLTPYLLARLPSGAYCRQSAEWSEGVILATVDEAHFASEIGRASAYFELRDGEGTLIATTQDFPLVTIANATGDGGLAEPYDSEIEDALAEMAEGIRAMGEAIEQFEHELNVLDEHDIDELFDEEGDA